MNDLRVTTDTISNFMSAMGVEPHIISGDDINLGRFIGSSLLDCTAYPKTIFDKTTIENASQEQLQAIYNTLKDAFDFK